MTSQLEVRVIGKGPRIVLVHGSIMNADICWAMQQPLSERFTLVMPNRRGYGSSPPADGEDFEVDARDIAELLENGDHLVGLSYGGVVSLLASAARPDAVASLTVIEPPAFGVARGDPEVEAFIDAAQAILLSDKDLYETLTEFGGLVGVPGAMPPTLPLEIEQGVLMLKNGRFPTEAEVPLDELRAAPFPKLVVRGEGHPSLLKVCDVLERELGAQGLEIKGMGHAVPFTGQPFNDALESFLTPA